MLHVLLELGLQLCVAFGQGKNMSDLYYRVAERAKHALLPYILWLQYCFRVLWKRDEVRLANLRASPSYVFRKLSQYPLVLVEGDMQDLCKQKFVVMMYNQPNKTESVDDVRLGMFAQKQRPCEAIPSTREA